jgi:ubiquitin C-terminal hydrolase
VVAMAILGVKLIEKPAKLEDKRPALEDKRPAEVMPADFSSRPRAVVENRPVGLRNASNNCWANSMLQFLMNIPNYSNVIFARRETSLTVNMRRYLEAEREKEKVSKKVNTQEIRSFLSREGRTHIDRSSHRQEDVSEALEYIFEEAHIYNPLLEAYLGKPFVEAPVGSPFIGLSLARAGENAPFAAHISQYFDFETDEHMRRLRKFQGGAPDDFIVKQERFYREDIRDTGEVIQGKHMQKIDVPERYMLPADYTTDETEDTPYECDTFINHIGTGINSGHYVAYVKKKNAQGKVSFWECNDSHVTEISERKFFRKMKEAYFLHFKKV